MTAVSITKLTIYMSDRYELLIKTILALSKIYSKEKVVCYSSEEHPITSYRIISNSIMYDIFPN